MRRIHIRSHIESRGGSRLSRSNGRGRDHGEIQSIEHYDPNFHDARDIVWSRSTEDNIFARNYVGFSDIDVMLFRYPYEYNEFRIDENDISISMWTDMLSQSLCYTIKQSGGSYKDSILNLGNQQEITTGMHIIVSHDWTNKLENIVLESNARNDIIFIHIAHKSEIHYVGTLYKSGYLDKHYETALNAHNLSIRNKVISAGCSYIRASTEDDPIDLLNYFFKYRYAG